MKQALTVLLMIELGLLAGPARGGDDGQFVILPDQQAQVETLFGRDLPGGWSFVGLDIGKNSLKVDFRHVDPGVRVSLSVNHPSVDVSPRLRTEEFAISVLESSARPDVEARLLFALEARLRAQEASWTWTHIARDPDETDVPPPDVGRGLGTAARWLERGSSAAADAAVRGLYTASFGRIALGRTAGRAAREGALGSISRAQAALTRRDVSVIQREIRRLERVWDRVAPQDRLVLAVDAGFVLLEAGLADAAEEWLRAAIADGAAAPSGVTSDSLGAFRRRIDIARARVGLGELEDPVAETDRLLAAAPPGDAACGLFLLAPSLSRVGRTDEAVALARHLHDRLGHCKQGTLIIAKLSMRTGRSEDLLDLLQDGAARYPDEVGVVSALANHYKFIKKPDEALRVLEGLVHRGHTNAGLLGEIMGMYARTEDRSAHEARFLKAADDHPDDPVAAFFAGALLHYKKDYARSTEYLLRAAPGLPHVPRVYLYLAMNQHRGSGDHAEAVRYIGKAVRTDATDPDVFYCRGVIHMDDDTDAAIADLETYLAMTRDSWDVPRAKTEKVMEIVKKLKACKGAEVPSQCVGVDPP
ncbi:MAG: hypothetical protein ABIK09_15285 [Pseudomonadota bacterium]